MSLDISKSSPAKKCRLAIARALYQNSSILILDEATSALDSRSELLVREAVQRLMENHTVRLRYTELSPFSIILYLLFFTSSIQSYLLDTL